MSVSAWAQNVDYNKIILPDYTKSPEFAEKLVQLAWKNNPTNEVLRREVNVATYTSRSSPAQWLDVVNVMGNINQFTLNPQSDFYGRAAFYPKYNIRFTLSLGQFLSIPMNTKINKERVLQAQANVNAQKLAIRSSVLKSYNEYVLREKIFKVQSQLLMDNETSHKLIEQRFKNGETNFETYSLSLTNFSNVTVSQLESERNYKNAKLDLEQLIGMRLEDVR